jgi:hypothetical protein
VDTPSLAPTHPPTTAGRGLLIAGGALSAWNGTMHLVLPLVFPWGTHTTDLYEPVRWALYAGTMFFGLLLLWAGLLVMVLACRTDLPHAVERWVYGGLAAFWVLGALYEVVVPFPAPVADLALPVFSVVVAFLLLAGLHRRRPRSSARWWARVSGSSSVRRRVRTGTAALTPEPAAPVPTRLTRGSTPRRSAGSTPGGMDADLHRGDADRDELRGNEAPHPRRGNGT